jgi:hypothetical protein
MHAQALSGSRLPAAFVAALAVSLVASCATPDAAVTGAASPVRADAPQYRVGDRWVYRVREGWRNPVEFDETHTVTAVGADGATVRVSAKGPTIDVERIERWPRPGLVTQGAVFDLETRRFTTPLERYRFPMKSGEHWTQNAANYNELTQRSGTINYYVRVGGTDRVTTPAGTFDALRLNVIMRLDDDEFWRWPTDCTYTVWYAPSARALVREVKRASYLEKGGGPDAGGRLPAQNTIIELLSFTPGA